MVVIFVVSAKIQALKQNLESWKTDISHHEFDSFLTHGRHFLRLVAIVQKGDYVMMCQHFEHLHNSVNQCFPSDHCMMIY